MAGELGDVTWLRVKDKNIDAAELHCALR